MLCAALGWLLRTYGAKLAPAVTLIGGLALLGAALYRYRQPIDALREMAAAGGMTGALSAVLRMMAVALLTTLAADICRDLGEASLATRVEFFGRAEVLLLCMPFLLELFSLALEVVK